MIYFLWRLIWPDLTSALQTPTTCVHHYLHHIYHGMDCLVPQICLTKISDIYVQSANNYPGNVE